MKILAGLAFAALMMVGSASATTYYVIGVCAASGASNNSVNASSGTCPTAASLGVTGLGQLVVASEFIDYNSDYALGSAPGPDQTTGNFVFTGAGLQYTSDTVTSTGNFNSNGGVCASTGLPVIGQATLQGLTIPAGCQNTVTNFAAVITVAYTQTVTQGSVGSDAAAAFVVYDYNITSGAPEPVSMVLFGGGLLGLSLLGRKKFARK